MTSSDSHGRTPGDTFGVEEEFLLVSATSRHPVPRAPQVLVKAANEPSSATDAALHPELISSQVEAATGRCTTAQDLRRQLVHARRRLDRAARAEQARLVASGTPVLGREAPPVSDSERFARISSVYGGVIADYQACGCHVHVGVPNHETAVAVVNHLRLWLPTLLALSGNSPFHLGSDTGYTSWRMMQQARFPGSGVPPRFGSAADYDEHLARLVDCGALIDADMTFWLARPSPRLPTVELRVADTAATVDEAVLQATLSRALVRTALAELDAGREAPGLPSQVAAVAVWSSARYGLRGPGIHPAGEHRVQATELARELLRYATPALEDTHDLAHARNAITRLLQRGTGAQRQRRSATTSLGAVVDMLTEQTVP